MKYKINTYLTNAIGPNNKVNIENNKVNKGITSFFLPQHHKYINTTTKTTKNRIPDDTFVLPFRMLNGS